MGIIDKTELAKFVQENEIGEDFNYDAEFMYRYIKDGKLVGVVAYMLQKDASGVEYPRFIHVILSESFRRTKEAYKFVRNTFRDLKDKGYHTVIAVIPHWKDFMITLAHKLKFNQYSNNDKYGYYRMEISNLIKGG